MTQDERINKTIEIAARLMASIFTDCKMITEVIQNKQLYAQFTIAIADYIISEAEKENK